MTKPARLRPVTEVHPVTFGTPIDLKRCVSCSALTELRCACFRPVCPRPDCKLDHDTDAHGATNRKPT